jgi:hypothetical protein
MMNNIKWAMDMSDKQLISILQQYGYSERHIERMLLWRNIK